MSFYLDLGTLLPKLSIFIFQGFQKLSEGEKTISAGEHKRWNRSRPKIKSVPISHGLCFFPQKYMCALHIYTFIFAASFSEGFLAQNKKNFSNPLQSNPAALDMNVGQRWLCSQPGAIFFACELCGNIYDSNMAKRFSVRSVDDSFHWHGSSSTI